MIAKLNWCYLRILSEELLLQWACCPSVIGKLPVLPGARLAVIPLQLALADVLV
jgi:hypothetical protein